MDQSLKFTLTPSTASPRRVVTICLGGAATLVLAVAGTYVLLLEPDRARLPAVPLPMLPDDAVAAALVASPLRHVQAYVPPSPAPYPVPQAVVDRQGALAAASSLDAAASSLDAAASRLVAVAGRLATLTDQMAARLPPGDAEAAGGQVGATARAVALDSAAMDDPGLLQWTVSALVAPYTYNYRDQAGQVATARSRFSRAGQDGADGPFGPLMDHEAAVRDR